MGRSALATALRRRTCGHVAAVLGWGLAQLFACFQNAPSVRLSHMCVMPGTSTPMACCCPAASSARIAASLLPCLPAKLLVYTQSPVMFSPGFFGTAGIAPPATRL